MSILCMRTKKDSSGRHLRDHNGYLVNFDSDGRLYSRCYMYNCWHKHDDDYYCGPVPCNLTFGAEKTCSNSSCPRFHYKEEVKIMAKRLELTAAPPKKLLNFLEIFTPEQFRFIMTTDEQKHYYENLKMQRAYKPRDYVPAPAPAPAQVSAPAPPVAQALVMPDMAKMFQLFMQQQAMNNFFAMTSASAPGMQSFMQSFMSSFVPSISQSAITSDRIPPLPPAPVQTRLPLLSLPPLPPPPPPPAASDRKSVV